MPTELKLHPDDIEKGYGRGPEARYLAEAEIKSVLKDFHDRGFLTKLSFAKLRDVTKFWKVNPETEGVDMSAVQFYPGQIPEDVANQILEAQPNTVIYQNLLPDQLLAPDFKVPRPDYEDPDNGVVMAVFYPFEDFEEMNKRWSEVMQIMDGEEVALSKAFENFGVIRYKRAPRAKLRNPKDEEYRLIEVWDPARYMGQVAEAANASVSALFVQYFSIPMKGFSPVSLTHAKFIFYTFRITPGPWKSLGRIIKGIHWDVDDEYSQVRASYNKTTGVFNIKSVEGKGDFIPALHQPSFAENIWRIVAEAIKHYFCDVYGVVSKIDIENFNELTKGHYETPIKWTGHPVVDYLALYFSYHQDVTEFLQQEEKDEHSLVYFRQTQVTLFDHLLPLRWIHENIYKRFAR